MMQDRGVFSPRVREKAFTRSVVVAALVFAFFSFVGAQKRSVVRTVPGVDNLTQNPLQIATLHWYDANRTANFGTAKGPRGIAFDGCSMWIVNKTAGTITKRQASDGTNLGAFTLLGTPESAAFDGSHIWVTDSSSGGKRLFKLCASDGSLLTTVTVGNQPKGLAFGGESVWVANSADDTITKVKASNGSVLGTFTVLAKQEGHLVFR
jgi:DNA-binding beta-propeller fold protein YncE